MRVLIKYFIAASNAVLVVALCLYAAIHLPSFSTAFYSWQFSANNTPAVVDMQHDELLRVTEHMLDYMRGRTPYLQIDAVVGGQVRPFFSEREILHMVDVRDLFELGASIRNIAAAWFLATVSILGFMRVPILLTLSIAYRWVIGVVVAALGLLTVLIARDFDHAWRIFHEIFFDNDLWLLDPATELLINIVPLAFFITLSIFVGVIFLALLTLLFVAAHFCCKRERRKRP